MVGSTVYAEGFVKIVVKDRNRRTVAPTEVLRTLGYNMADMDVDVPVLYQEVERAVASFHL